MHLSSEVLWSFINNEIDGERLRSIQKHLRGCDSCRERLKAIERNETIFRALVYPVPSEDFCEVTSQLAVSGTKTGRSIWVLVFKACLLLSFLLITSLSFWLGTTIEIDIPLPENILSMVWYSLPLVFIVFVMKTMEGRAVKDNYL